ncbi:cell division protein FtsA [Candidatus Shapirobacteria bacterium CG09_land_8_20_14_0_10_49_15]|uniref:Cell division protein FtsA n=2 Tax=Candidatus Shapironibacteriota TaxID=1752721 RepID=A0A2M8L6F8_9BACT|nr:MAG: cell division protein FtsA [Candidatus Shapirobacteria bacterium CG09_land_8_20_14_0_10_49_15]PJE69811.1 MAG: cell division protein FtsA [Candidatus Shapirobacteria bacterium CG10_big_fil_rev_8_21_14_0_10_48_15]
MTRQKITAGIDVGSSKVATLIASSDDDQRLKIIGAASVPSKGVKKGQIVDIEEAAESILQSVEAAERMAGYNLTRAFVSIGGAHINSFNSKGVVAVSEPEGEIAAEDVDRVIEAAQAVSLPSPKEVLHVLPRYYIVDGQEGVKDPVGMSGVRLEVETHIIAGSTTAIKNLTKCIEQMGINVEEMVAGGLASAESVLSETEKELGVVLIDIGGGTTSLLIYVEGAPFYAAVLPIGAKNVTNDLAIGLRLSSLETAEKIKIALSVEEKKPVLPKKAKLEEDNKDDELNLAKLGIMGESRTVSKKTLVEGIIKPRLNEIMAMVAAEIKESGAAGLTPAGAVICGGGAQTVGLTKVAKQALMIPVRLAEPRGLTGLVDEIQTPAYATVTGLLLYGLQATPKTKAGFSLGSIGKRLPRIPVRGAAGKVLALIRSFLP